MATPQKSRRAAIKDLKPSVEKGRKVKGGHQLQEYYLQSYMDRAAKLSETTSNILKTTSDTNSEIISNIK